MVDKEKFKASASNFCSRHFHNYNFCILLQEIKYNF